MWALVAPLCVALLGWITLAIYFSPLEPPWTRAALAALVPIGATIALIRVRPLRRVSAMVLGAFVVVLAAWLTISPSNDRDWQPDVATLPFADVRGDHVIVHNVRNAEYRTVTDYTVRLEDRELDLSKLRSLDLFLIHWGSPWIAHTIVSWGFGGDQYLAISIETRKAKGQEYSGASRVLPPVRAHLRRRRRARRRAPAHELPRRGCLRVSARRAPGGCSEGAAPISRRRQSVARPATVVTARRRSSIKQRLDHAAHQNPFHRVHSGNAIVIPNRTVVWGATGAFWR